MEYLAGLATALVLFLVYQLGKRSTKRTPKLTEGERTKLEQRKKELEEIFSYNLDKAISGGGKD